MAKIALFEGTLRIEKDRATIAAVVSGGHRLVVPLVGNLPPGGVYRAKGCLYRFTGQYALHLHNIEVAVDPREAWLIGSADQLNASGATINRTGHFNAQWLALCGDQFFVSEGETVPFPGESERPPAFLDSDRDVIEIVPPRAPSSESALPGPAAQTNGKPPVPSERIPDPSATGVDVVITPQKRLEPFPVTTKPEPLLHGPAGTAPRIQGQLGASSPPPGEPLPPKRSEEQTIFLPPDSARPQAQKTSPAKGKARRAKESPPETKPSAGITAEEIQKFSF